MDARPRTRQLAVLALAAPGLLQLALLLTAMFGRLAYPYDLEWMEGGLLEHAARIADGRGIYVPPSIDFIPFLYTPLYPGLLALLSPLFGIGYTVGRVISVLATLGVLWVIAAAIHRDVARRDRALAWLGCALAAGFFAATYPWVEGWYDIVRADSLFLVMVLGGLLGIRVWARTPKNAGLAKLGAAAAVLGLSFFCKQTGVLFVAAGGALLLVLHWRRVPLYVAVTGVLGLGGTWLLDRVSGGWFWTYVYEVHQAHDFSRDRFVQSFGNILWRFPAMTLVIAAGLLAVAVTAIAKRRRPESSAALLVWTPIFAISVLVGAVGWGTEFAHFNAYIPAMTTGALCAGAALPALAGCARAWWPGARWRPGELVPAAAAAALGVQLILAWWQPGMLIPSAEDRRRGDALVEHIRRVDGEVFVPYHPWYAALAGKKVHVHFMGLRDMMTGKTWDIRGLPEAFQEQRFAEVVVDNRPIGRELAGLRARYRLDDFLPPSHAPRVYTGAGAIWKRDTAKLVPRSIWVPNRTLEPPEEARVLFDFEDGALDGWDVRGKAWGRRPVSRPLPKQGPVRRYGGRYFASSFHGGDPSTGILRSPAFDIDGSRLSFRLSGGRDQARLRAELHVAGEVVKSATGNGSERMEEITWNVAPYAGKRARLVLVDDAKGSWGHLNVDELWLWD